MRLLQSFILLVAALLSLFIVSDGALAGRYDAAGEFVSDAIAGTTRTSDDFARITDDFNARAVHGSGDHVEAGSDLVDNGQGVFSAGHHSDAASIARQNEASQEAAQAAQKNIDEARQAENARQAQEAANLKVADDNARVIKEQEAKVANDNARQVENTRVQNEQNQIVQQQKVDVDNARIAETSKRNDELAQQQRTQQDLDNQKVWQDQKAANDNLAAQKKASDDQFFAKKQQEQKQWDEAQAPAHKNNTEGIYEFVDKSGKPYCGQSCNVTARLNQHIKSGKLDADQVVKVKEVPGGKLAREIEEHKRIQEITGNVPARFSDKVSNKVDPIGKKRSHVLND